MPAIQQVTRPQQAMERALERRVQQAWRRQRWLASPLARQAASAAWRLVDVVQRAVASSGKVHMDLVGTRLACMADSRKDRADTERRADSRSTWEQDPSLAVEVHGDELEAEQAAARPEAAVKRAVATAAALEVVSRIQ